MYSSPSFFQPDYYKNPNLIRSYLGQNVRASIAGLGWITAQILNIDDAAGTIGLNILSNQREKYVEVFLEDIYSIEPHEYSATPKDRAVSEKLSKNTRQAGKTSWTREQAMQIKVTADNMAPLIHGDDFFQTSMDLWLWDTWPLNNKDGSVTVINGWKIVFSLSAPRSVGPEQRHDIAAISYFYSRDGFNWIEGGLAFPIEMGLGSRQWAGSAMYDNGRLYLFYTAAGRKGEPKVTFEQRIVLGAADVRADLSGVCFTNWDQHKIILEADGKLYQTMEQADGPIIYSFRDPWFFKDPNSGEEYLLFEGNTPGPSTTKTCMPVEARVYNGSIGIAKLKGNDYTKWELLPHIFDAECVNQQLERPHLVLKNNRYYLFTVTHKFTFAPGITAPDGLYGFISDRLMGGYIPLDNGGLVVANPINEELQAYSWFVLSNETILSFINWYDTGGIDPGRENIEFQFKHFGGAYAPTLQISLNGTHSRIIRELEQGLVIAGSYEEWQRFGR
ncbi:MAG: glycoside hydrolase family 68 protein [Clostridiaceae bacterium]